jgi:hypothetical protein
MAIVKVTFDGGDVPVVTGVLPPASTVPIANPIPTGGTTNAFFITAAGVKCFGLETSIPHTPLWLSGNAMEGVPLELSFKKIEDDLSEMG